MKFLTSFLAVSCVILLVACKKPSKEADAYIAAEVLYNNAMDQLERKEYKDAAESFQKVEEEHPFSVWATRGLVMEGYAQFAGGEYEEAITACERFLQLHPRHADAPYMTYLKAVSLYQQIGPVQRDQTLTEEAKLALQEVMRKYPDLPYARDARLKHALTLDHLAGREMETGRYYLTQRKINAALSRFSVVVDQYQTTSHVPEALYRMTEAYVSFGVREEATRIAAVLGHNYPESDWYQKAYRLIEKTDR